MESQHRAPWLSPSLALGVLLGLSPGCGCTDPGGSDAGGDTLAIDALVIDTPVIDTAATDARGDTPPWDTGGDAPDGAPLDVGADAPVVCDETCGAVELCRAGDGDGSDDDCDGMVDETCTCAPGTARGCFPGDPAARGVGACVEGVMVCGDDGAYGACEGGVVPSTEACNGSDDDCDGRTDESLAGCVPVLACPGAELSVPLRAHPLVGTAIYGGTARSWRWTVTCPGGVGTCPTPLDPSLADTSVFLVSSGNYRVRLDVELDDGTTPSCEWVVYARGEGLRVEMGWDTQGAGRGDTDVDLHLHRRSITPGSGEVETDFFTPDDCFYLGCKASTYDYDGGALRARWALPDNPDLSVCQSAPGGEGAVWTTLGACYQPRLDVDVIGCDPSVTEPTSAGFCANENINVDTPPLGEPFRIWVNYFSEHAYRGDTHPYVNVYCYGELRAQFGRNGEVTLREGDETTSARVHDSWTVADVVFEIDPCGRPTCRIAPIGIVRPTDDFGPPWSF